MREPSEPLGITINWKHARESNPFRTVLQTVAYTTDPRAKYKKPLAEDSGGAKRVNARSASAVSTPAGIAVKFFTNACHNAIHKVYSYYSSAISVDGASFTMNARSCQCIFE